MRLIDADKVMQMIPTEEYNARQAIAFAPTVDAEPTEKQVKEYCRKRCLVVVDSGLFNEMKARWSEETVKHGRWVKPNPKGIVTYDEHAYAECSLCHQAEYLGYGMAYCPHCGAKTDGGNT